MYHFIEMMETAKKNKEIWLVDQRDLKPLPHDFFEFMSLAEIFVFASPQKVPIDYLTNDNISKFKIYDQPFKITSFEMFGKEKPIAETDIDNNERSEIYCLVSVENRKDPSKTILFSFFKVKRNGIVTRKFIGMISKYQDIFQILLNRLNSEECGIEKVKHRVLTGTGSQKGFTIKKIVHVRPKRPKNDDIEYGYRQIEWTHRWSVRGHWRKIGGLGKDRSGNYCILNYTWVAEHIKGPDNKPIIKKVRIVHNKSV